MRTKLITIGTVVSGVVFGVGAVQVQADTNVMASTMMIDIATQSMVFLFI